MSNVVKKEEEVLPQIKEVAKQNESLYTSVSSGAKKEKEAQFMYSSKSPRMDPVNP